MFQDAKCEIRGQVSHDIECRSDVFLEKEDLERDVAGKASCEEKERVCVCVREEMDRCKSGFYRHSRVVVMSFIRSD